MKKSKKRTPVLPSEHTPEELQLREYADKINQKRKEDKTPKEDDRRLRDVRLPLAGAVLEKKYKGMEISVKVLEVGFEYNSKYYKTLSAVACAITGQHISGYHFFGL